MLFEVPKLCVTSGHDVQKLELCPCNTKEEGRCMRAATFFLCFSLKLNAVKKRKCELCF